VIAGSIAYVVANATDTEVIRFGTETANRGRERIAALSRDLSDKLYLCTADQLGSCYEKADNALEQAYKREALAIVSPRRLSDNPTQIDPALRAMHDQFLAEESGSRQRLKDYYLWVAKEKQVPPAQHQMTPEERQASTRYPIRNKTLIGPMDSFAFDYLTLKQDAHYRQRYEIFNLPVNSYAFETAYEALNFADGSRSVLEITKALQAEFGDVPLHAVDQYMGLLAEAGAIEWKSANAGDKP
jgi:hypothetical protein